MALVDTFLKFKVRVSIVINPNGEYSKQSAVLVNGCRQLSGCSHRGGYSDASTRRRDGGMTQPATPGTDPVPGHIAGRLTTVWQCRSAHNAATQPALDHWHYNSCNLDRAHRYFSNMRTILQDLNSCLLLGFNLSGLLDHIVILYDLFYNKNLKTEKCR